MGVSVKLSDRIYKKFIDFQEDVYEQTKVTGLMTNPAVFSMDKGEFGDLKTSSEKLLEYL